LQEDDQKLKETVDRLQKGQTFNQTIDNELKMKINILDFITFWLPFKFTRSTKANIFKNVYFPS